MSRLLGFAVFVLALAALIWLSDRVTLQGERTIYTVICEDGSWQGSHCTGRLAPADRYAFRVSPRRHEVIYWIRASDKPSGKYTDCNVIDRDNWSCNVPADQPPTLAYEMTNGQPIRGVQGATIAFHFVPKWKWWLIKLGVPMFSNADG